MTGNLPIDIPEIRRPRDMAQRARFIDAVEQRARRLGLAGAFSPPRFFGYYFTGPHPVVIAGQWTVMLDEVPPLVQIRQMVERITESRFSISSRESGGEPEFMLVHDRRDGGCWLWDYAHGRRFVEAHEPVSGADDFYESLPPGDGPKLLGP